MSYIVNLVFKIDRMYLLFDTVHLLHCLRNKGISQEDKIFIYPDFHENSSMSYLYLFTLYLWNETELENTAYPQYLGVTLDMSVSYNQHVQKNEDGYPQQPTDEISSIRNSSSCNQKRCMCQSGET